MIKTIIICGPTASGKTDISVALAEMRVSILQINSQKKSDDSIIINLKIGCKNIEHFRSIVGRLKSLRDVEEVRRGFS